MPEGLPALAPVAADSFVTTPRLAAMARIEITGEALTVHTEGWDRILALKSQVTIPLEHVVSVEQDMAEASAVYHGLRLPGTSLPGVVTAGSYLRQGEWSFWDVHDPQKAVILRLRDEHYAKVVVGVDDPDATAQQLRAALAAHSAQPGSEIRGG